MVGMVQKGSPFGTKVDTWAPEVTLHAHRYALNFMQMCEVYS